MIRIFLPSRGRPEKLKRCLDSIRKTSQAEVFLYLDSDDPTVSEYPLNEVDNYVIGKPIYLGPAYQYLWDHYPSDLIQMGADDLFYKSKDWDKIVESCNKEVISFDDGGRPRKEDGHPFIRRSFIEKHGFMPEGLLHSCVDNWIVDIARKTEQFGKVDINIQHLHPKYNKGEWDDTYLRNTKELKKLDGARYKKMTRGQPHD